MKQNHIRLVAILGLTGFLFSALPGLAQTAPVLGDAANFSVLGAETVTNSGPTIVTGHLGVSPGSEVTGFPPGLVVGGSIHAADALAAAAQFDASAAYTSLAAQPCNTTFGVPTDLGGMTLTPGVYCFSDSLDVTGLLQLDAQGDPNAIFIFNIETTFRTAVGASVVVINGGSNCNVFFRVGSSATLFTASSVPGTIIALATVTLQTGANLSGRAIALTGAVNLAGNRVGGCTGPIAGEAVGSVPALDPVSLAILMVLIAFAGLFVIKRV